jgi:catechol 2,3-dioxygenase-like lactoylglutathione lyase family enzyme
MFSHITVGVSDYARAAAFYKPLMETLGLPIKFTFPETGAVAWGPANVNRPLFLITKPFNQTGASAGNGSMTALMAPNRAAVDQCHKLALANGGKCEGPPGLRTHYHPHYYGAYFRDPDGNKLCVVCHDPA